MFRIFVIALLIFCFFGLGYAKEDLKVDILPFDNQAQAAYLGDKQPIIVYSKDEISRYADEHEVICEGAGWKTCTAKFCGNGYYDKEGLYHPPEPCNTCTEYFSCSDGQDFELKEDAY